MGKHVDGVMELAGLALIVAFAYVVWAPAALVTAGVILFLAGNGRALKRKRAEAAELAKAEGRQVPASRPLLERIVSAYAAYRGGAR